MNSTTEQPFIFSDLKLSRRLERTEGSANAEFVEARARFFPDSGASWMEAAGAYAMFDGVSSPFTQTFGLCVFEPKTANGKNGGRAITSLKTNGNRSARKKTGHWNCRASFTNARRDAANWRSRWWIFSGTIQ